MTNAEIYFPVDEIRNKLQQVATKILSGQSYKDENVHQWSHDICSNSIKELYLLEQPYKYVVSCVIMQQMGVSAHCAVSCKADKQHDHIVQAIYGGDDGDNDGDNDDNIKEISCIITAVAVVA